MGGALYLDLVTAHVDIYVLHWTMYAKAQPEKNT